MKVPAADIAIVLLAFVVAASAIQRTRDAVTIRRDEAITVVHERTLGTSSLRDGNPSSPADSTDYAQLVIANDVFRLANAPAQVRYTLATEGMSGIPGMSGMPQPLPFRPQLVLKAVIGGPPWHAMLEGVPGGGSVIVRSGQVIGALTVRSVGRDTVVVQGADTTWKLTLLAARP